MVPYHIGADFALAAAERDICLTKSLEGLAMKALKESSSIEDTMYVWLRQWGL